MEPSKSSRVATQLACLVVLGVLVCALVGRVAGTRIGRGDRVREFGLRLRLAARHVLVPLDVKQAVDQTADDDQNDLKDAQRLLFLAGSDDPDGWKRM